MRRTFPWRTVLLDWALPLVLLVGLLFWLRGSSLLSPGLANPDEAELLAAGKRAMDSLVPYASATSATYLFLWPAALAVIGYAGLALGLPLAHLLSGIAMWVLVACIWVCLRRWMKPWRAFLIVLPVAIVLFAGPHPDYLSLTTEMLPVVVLAASVTVAFAPTRPIGSMRFAVASALVGLSVWAKPQVLPMAVALLAVLITQRLMRDSKESLASGPARPWWRGPIGRATAGAVGWFLFPTLVFVIAMAIGGTLGAFLDEPVRYQLDYLIHRQALQPGTPSPSLVNRLGAIAQWLPIGAVALLAPIVSAGAPGRVGVFLRPRSWRASASRRAVVSLGALSIGGLLSAIGSYPYYAHYGVFLFAGVLFGAVAATAMETASGEVAPRPSSPGVSAASATPIVVLVLAVAVIQCAGNVFRVPSFPTGWSGLSSSSATLDRYQSASLAGLRAACPPGSKVYVWGWAPEYYSYLEWLPASRYVNSVWQIFPTSLQAKYRQRLASDIAKSKPQCVLDAVGARFFYFSAEQALGNVDPQLATALRVCYREQMVQAGGANLHLWIRKRDCPEAP